MKISLNLTAKISEKALFQEVNNEAVILDLKSESYYGLNDVGLRIWQLIGQNKTLQQIHDDLMVEFDVEADTLQRDILTLVEELAKAGLIKLDEEE